MFNENDIAKTVFEKGMTSKDVKDFIFLGEKLVGAKFETIGNNTVSIQFLTVNLDRM
jgi:hypothetical protein